MNELDYWIRELRYRLGSWVVPGAVALGTVALIQIIWHVAAWVVS